MYLGIDSGGTFTDFVCYDGSGLRVHKVLSTPAMPEKAILHGIEESGVELANLHIVHGSTVATNAVLEAKGVRTVFIANHDLQDMLTIGLQTRQQLYALQPQFQPLPVAENLCLATGGLRKIFLKNMKSNTATV